MPESPFPELADRIFAAEARLSGSLAKMRFAPPVACVYNPLDYAAAPHREYVERYARPTCEVLLLGMNPGPWGMAQTGVPFGEVAAVRDWMGIHAPVSKPERELPARPILGFDCTRSEVSGARLWGWAKAQFGSPENFFSRFFVYNYCPLSFMEEGGRNLTPDKLPAVESKPLTEACDENLREVVAALHPKFLIGVGGFATKRLRAACGNCPATVGEILHPSPASPAANRGWAEAATRQLRELGVAW